MILLFRSNGSARLAACLPWLLLLGGLAWPLGAQPRISTVAPADAPSEVAVTGPSEPGEPLVIQGEVLGGSSGVPLPGASLFVYQTGADGLYGPRGNADPRLRAYLRTDDEGRFVVRTIRPGAYPGGGVAAHIHYHLRGADGEPRKVGELVFADDPLVTPRMEASSFHRVVEPERDEEGVWRVRVTLELPGG